MAAIIVAGGTAENRKRMVEGRFLSTRIHLFWMPEHITRTYRLPSHVIFILLQEIKDDLESQVYQNLQQTFIFGLRFFSTYYGFVISLFFICDYVNLHCIGQYVN